MGRRNLPTRVEAQHHQLSILGGIVSRLENYVNSDSNPASSIDQPEGFW
jgi:hypothetical protein